jgi:alpha-L-rhamnosidase
VDIKITSTAYFYYIVNITQAVSVYANPGDTAYLNNIKNKVKQYFIENFRNEDGTYGKDEWTANGCALYFGFENSPKLAQHLVEQVRANNHKADFGIVGAKIVPRVLATYNYAIDAWKLYTQTEFPGWGYWIKEGATSLWEHWKGSGSQFHIMYGDFTAWCFEYLAGIKILAPGFKEIELAPKFVGNAGNCKFSYKTPFGPISIEIKNNTYFYSVPKAIKLKLNIPKEFHIEAL